MFQGSQSRERETPENFGGTAWESAHWSRLQELFHLAGNAPPGEQTRILREACSDSLLVDRVLELLAVSPDTPAPAAPVGDTVPLGTRVGPYALLRHLGTGGLGSVYLAERIVGGALQQCALKVLSMHAAGPQFESRFQREQQILATLNHPHITRLLDAGFSETRQPYLTMEYVDGVDVVRYCDGGRLSIADRLRIFLQICDAVAYAHRNLTVHLDLKPTNVLVSTQGEVKLLDFGTSKLISPDTTLTTTILATPAYAAPEQLRNEPVTTACDVYSLGAILFELLSGERPFQHASAALMVERAFGEQEPGSVLTSVTQASAEARGVAPARLKQLLDGDLSTVVTRCLHSRPRDRYPSVDALAEDVRRHLGGRPVLTRPQTLRYRLAKFVRRHRTGVGLGALTSVIVLASLVYGAWRQQQALTAAQRAVQMQTFMTRLLRLSHSGATGKPAATVAEMLQVGAHILPSFISDPADLRVARLSLAESMNDDDDHKDALPILLDLAQEARRSGDVAVEAKSEAIAGDIQYLLGHPQEGDALTTRALAVARDRRVPADVRTQVVALYVSNHDDAGDRTDGSMGLLRAAVDESEQAHAPEEETASAMNILGLGLQARGHIDEAQRYFERSLAIYARSPYATCDTAATQRYLAYLAYKRADDADALRQFQRSYALQRQCAGDDDLGTLSAQAWVGLELTRNGRPAEAISLLEPAMDRWHKAVGINSQHMRTPLHMLSTAYLRTGRYRDAEGSSREELRVLQGKTAQRSANMAAAEEGVAAALYGEGRYAEALPLAQAALADLPRSAISFPSEMRQVGEMRQLLLDTEARLHQTPPAN